MSYKVCNVYVSRCMYADAAHIAYECGGYIGVYLYVSYRLYYVFHTKNVYVSRRVCAGVG